VALANPQPARRWELPIFSRKKAWKPMEKPMEKWKNQWKPMEKPMEKPHGMCFHVSSNVELHIDKGI
jgi:hypothetical protein